VFMSPDECTDPVAPRPRKPRRGEDRNPSMPQIDKVLGQAVATMLLVAHHRIEEIAELTFHQHDRKLRPFQEILRRLIVVVDDGPDKAIYATLAENVEQPSLMPHLVPVAGEHHAGAGVAEPHFGRTDH